MDAFFFGTSSNGYPHSRVMRREEKMEWILSSFLQWSKKLKMIFPSPSREFGNSEMSATWCGWFFPPRSFCLAHSIWRLAFPFWEIFFYHFFDNYPVFFPFSLKTSDMQILDLLDWTSFCLSFLYLFLFLSFGSTSWEIFFKLLIHLLNF